MRDNAFGSICKLGMVGWTGFMFWSCIDGFRRLQAVSGERPSDLESGLVILGNSGIWLAGSVAILVVYLLLGRSDESMEPKGDTPKRRWTCEKCGTFLDPSKPFCQGCGASKPAPAEPATVEKTCPACFAKIDARATVCRYCRTAQ